MKRLGPSPTISGGMTAVTYDRQAQSNHHHGREALTYPRRDLAALAGSQDAGNPRRERLRRANRRAGQRRLQMELAGHDQRFGIHVRGRRRHDALVAGALALVLHWQEPSGSGGSGRSAGWRGRSSDRRAWQRLPGRRPTSGNGTGRDVGAPELDALRPVHRALPHHPGKQEVGELVDLRFCSVAGGSGSVAFMRCRSAALRLNSGRRSRRTCRRRASSYPACCT